MEEIIKNIFEDKFNIDKSSIHRDTPLLLLVDDSLGKIELLFAVEEALNVRIPHDDVVELETFGEFVSLLESLKDKK